MSDQSHSGCDHKLHGCDGELLDQGRAHHWSCICVVCHENCESFADWQRTCTCRADSVKAKMAESDQFYGMGLPVIVPMYP
jgi:hypothetical protein